MVENNRREERDGGRAHKQIDPLANLRLENCAQSTRNKGKRGGRGESHSLVHSFLTHTFLDKAPDYLGANYQMDVKMPAGSWDNMVFLIRAHMSGHSLYPLQRLLEVAIAQGHQYFRLSQHSRSHGPLAAQGEVLMERQRQGEGQSWRLIKKGKLQCEG